MRSFFQIELYNKEYRVVTCFDDENSIKGTTIDRKLDTYIYKTILRLPPTQFDYSNLQAMKQKLQMLLAFS